MKADATLHHRPEGAYARELFDATGLTIVEAAERLGLSRRALQYYISGQKPMPYTVQFTLEHLRGK